MASTKLNTVDKIEILTLQDNYIEMTAMEKQMPDQFILNMAGTKLTFA